MQVQFSPQSSTNDRAPDDPLIREHEAARVLDLSVKCLQAWRVSGKGPKFIKLGSGLRSPVRYRHSDLIRFLADCERGSTAGHSTVGAG